MRVLIVHKAPVPVLALLLVISLPAAGYSDLVPAESTVADSELPEWNGVSLFYPGRPSGVLKQNAGQTISATEYMFATADWRMETYEQKGQGGSSAAMIVEYNSSTYPTNIVPANSSAAAALPRHLSGIAYQLRQPGSQEYSFGLGSRAARYFSLSQREAKGASVLPPLHNPYFSFKARSAHAGVARQVAGVRIKFGILSNGLNHAMARNAFDQDALSPALITVQPRMNAKVLEFSTSCGASAVSLSMVRSKEKALAASPSRTVTSFGLSTATNSVQLTGVWLMVPKLALAAQASYGRTPTGRSIGTVNDGMSIRSNAFSLGMVASGWQHTADRLSFAVSQPIRVYEGGLAAEAVNGRELLAEVNYVRPLDRATYAGWAVFARREPNNVPTAPLEKAVAMRFVKQF